MMNDEQRIVISGMGLVTPLGVGVDAVWQRLIQGESGIRQIDAPWADGLKTKIAGLVPSHTAQSNGFNALDYLSEKEQKRVDLFTLYALGAAQEALTQANWQPSGAAEEQSSATIIGTGIGGLPTITQAQSVLQTRGAKRLSPFTVPAFLANLAAGNVSIKYRLKGPLGTPVTACAAGIQAIGDAMRLIKCGEASIALAGGTEACVDPLALAGFGALKALSTDNDAPHTASRPFDKTRAGFVMGEGAGLVVLESLAHAKTRGAKALVEVVGYGTSADAYHLTSGPQNGEGAARAINAAIKMAGIKPAEIGYINAHATSTPVGDAGEIAALRVVFGDALADIPISATKSATGHLLGAAGGVAAIFSAKAILQGELPATLNLHQSDEQMQDLDLIALKARNAEVDYVLCNGFGFGGVNAALILKRIR